jgi:hypothetical protein
MSESSEPREAAQETTGTVLERILGPPLRRRADETPPFSMESLYEGGATTYFVNSKAYVELLCQGIIERTLETLRMNLTDQTARGWGSWVCQGCASSGKDIKFFSMGVAVICKACRDNAAEIP